MLIIAGLGNPGGKYARHRHNVGFMAADAIADTHGFGPAREKFSGLVREGFLTGPNGRFKTLIIKPQTFMNESGRSVRAAVDFYKLCENDVVVLYDELDLAPGKLRVKTGGGAAGHNGIRSIDSHLGNGFRRVRIGIGHPGERSKVTKHVLGDFSKTDQQWLDPMMHAIAAAAPFLGDGEDQRFATDVAQRLAPPRPEKKPKARRAAPADRPGEDNNAAQPSEPRSGANPFADALRKLFGD